MLNTIRFGFESKISDARLSRQGYNSQKIAEDEQLIENVFSGFKENNGVIAVTLTDGEDNYDRFEITVKGSKNSEHHTLVIDRRKISEEKINKTPLSPLKPFPFESDSLDRLVESIGDLRNRVNPLLTRALAYWTEH